MSAIVFAEFSGALNVIVLILVLATAFVIIFENKIIREYERGLLYRKGRFIRVLSPGSHWIRRRKSKIEVLDMRERTLQIAGQEVLTADQVIIKTSLVAIYRVNDPVKATHVSESYRDSLYTASQLALRKIVARFTLDELIDQRLAIGSGLLKDTAALAQLIGLSLNSIEIKDFMLPADLRRAYSETLRARKEGQAALERARGETAALRNLANAARLLKDNPQLLNLRYLQAMSSGSPSQTVVFNIPGTQAPIIQDAKPSIENAVPPPQTDDEQIA